MNKLTCGIAVLGFLVSSVFASDSYYVFSGSNVAAWGTNNYVMGFTWGTVTLNNPENPYSPGTKDFVNEGVGKIINASVTSGGGVFIAVKKSGSGAANDKTIMDCTQGFSYWYQGGAHIVTLEYPAESPNCTGTSAQNWNNKWQVSATAEGSWTKKIIQLTDLAQVPDGGCNVASVDLSIAGQLAWGTQTAVTGYNLMIGNVACLVDGEKDDDVAPTADIAWVAGDEVCDGYCKWGTTCSPITTDKNGTNGTVIATCEAAIANCATNSGNPVYTNSTCTTTPIISHNSVSAVGLNVVSFARSLKITSGKDATVSLFDMNGKQVLSQRVFSGTTTISLANQREGVYYAVVKSDSHKQTVKVVLK